MNLELIKKAAIEDSFDEAFPMMAKGFGIDDIPTYPKFNMVPNTHEVRRILKIGRAKYYECGLWIVLPNGDINNRYDEFNSIEDALEKSDLFPRVGEGDSYMRDYFELL